ncbi:MAG: HAD family phosphatase [Treponema sp.]|nr:HAD family phosphatase [Treponema sp.]
MKITAVAFDYGGVIAYPPGPEALEELAALAGLDRQTLESLMWRYREDYDRGLVSGKAYYKALLARKGVHPGDGVLEKMAALDSAGWTHINPGTVRLMEDLKGAGLKLGILSNMPHEFLVMARERFPVFKLPQAGIFSCELGLVKPGEAIYRALLSALGCEPGGTVFFDDMPANVDAAVSLGIRAFVWRDVEAARKQLRDLAVPV